MKINELVQSLLTWIKNLGGSKQQSVAVTPATTRPSIYATGLWETNAVMPSDVTVGAFFVQDNHRQQPSTETQSLANAKDFF
jgi:hypothetical protein